jgi:hypothetical protein
MLVSKPHATFKRKAICHGEKKRKIENEKRDLYTDKNYSRQAPALLQEYHALKLCSAFSSILFIQMSWFVEGLKNGE